MGSPGVFEHNGEKRVYVYGSHDTERKEYCGRNYVVWSAPVTDLTNWTYHGVSYETHYDSMRRFPRSCGKVYTKPAQGVSSSAGISSLWA